MPLPRTIKFNGVEPSKSEAPTPPSKPLYRRVLDTLNKPGAALAGGLSEMFTKPTDRKVGVVERVKQNLTGDRQDDFDTFLGERGMQDGKARAALGFAGDLVLDPLNIVPIGKAGGLLAKGASTLGTKALGKGAHLFSNYAGDIDDLAKQTLKLADSRVQALPDVLATRLGRRATQIKQANPTFRVDDIRTALTAQVRPDLYNVAKSNELERLLQEMAPRAVPGKAVSGVTAKVNLRRAQMDGAAKKRVAPLLKGKVFTQDLADHINRRLADVAKPTFVESTPILRTTVKPLTDLFRETATVWRPKFHSSNAIGNIENIYKSGVTVPRMLGSLGDVRRFSKAFRNASSLPAAQARAKIPGTNVTMAEAIAAFERYGLQHGIGDLTGVSASNAGGTILDKTIDVASKQAVGTGERLRDALGRGSVGQRIGNAYRFVRDAGPKRFGDAIERNSKTLKYIDSLKQGKTPEQAVLDVQDTLFNYRDVTDFERNLREVMPFYTFTRKNLPFQTSSLLSRPNNWERMGDLTNAIENASTTEGQEIPESATPTFINDMNGFQVVNSKADNPVFGIPNFAGQDINKLDVLNPSKMGRDWLSGLSPLAKAPIELGLNRTIYDQRPVWDEDLGPLESYSKAPEAVMGLPEGLRNFLTRDRAEVKFGKLTGKTITESPSLLAYAMKQVPVGQAMGKVSLGVNNPDALNNKAAALSELTGIPLYEIGPEQQARQQAWQGRETRRIGTKKRNIEKRTVREREEALQEALRLLGIDQEEN